MLSYRCHHTHIHTLYNRINSYHFGYTLRYIIYLENELRLVLQTTGISISEYGLGDKNQYAIRIVEKESYCNPL